jgi:hypothetical protein
MGAIIRSSEDEQVVEPELETLRASHRETTVGEQSQGIGRLKPVVLVLGRPIEDSKPLAEMDQSVHLRRRHCAHDATVWTEQRNARSHQGMLRVGCDVLEHPEHGDGVVAIPIGQCPGCVALDESKAPAIAGHRRCVNADARSDPPFQRAKQCPVAASDVEHVRAAGDVRRRLANAPGLQDRVALFDLRSNESVGEWRSMPQYAVWARRTAPLDGAGVSATPQAPGLQRF